MSFPLCRFSCVVFLVSFPLCFTTIFQVLHNIGLSWLTRPRWSQLAMKIISRGNETSTSRWRRPTIFYEMWSLSILQGTLSSPIWAGWQFTFKFVTTQRKTFINVAAGQLISNIVLFLAATICCCFVSFSFDRDIWLRNIVLTYFPTLDNSH